MGDADDHGESSRAPIKVKVFGRTDVGLIREHNEDNFLVADLETGNRSLLPEVRDHTVGPRGTLLAVCDGMGGAAAGEVASQIGVDTVYELMQQDEPPTDVEDLAARLEDAVLDAGKKIFDSAKADRSRRGMGTTITTASLISDRIIFAQVGDSRAYLIRNGEMMQVTRDQSLVNQLIEAGQLKPEEAELFEHSNIILQALGTAEDVTVDLTFADLRRGDTIVMCSDGLSGLVTDEQIRDMVVEASEPIDACKSLTEAAREGGGHDNITVIVAQFDGEGLEPPDDTTVEFQRLTLPGRKEFSIRQQPAAPGWQPPEDEGDGAEASAASSSEPATNNTASRREPKKGSNPLFLGIAVLVVLALGVVLGFLIVNGGFDSTPPSTADATASNTTDSGTDQVDQLIPCYFNSDVPDTRLIIDGSDYGQLPRDGRTLSLPPGDHSIEGRFGEQIVDSRILTLTPGQVQAELVFEIAQLLEPPPAALLDAGAQDTDAFNAPSEAAEDADVTDADVVEEPDAESQTSTTPRPGKIPPRRPPPRPVGPIDPNPY